MTIDNIQLIRSKITFLNGVQYNTSKNCFKTLPHSFDRYVIQILHRNKDEQDPNVKNKWKNTLLKTYEIDSFNDFDEHIPEIINICKVNNARAMITPQVRDIRDCIDMASIMLINARSNPTIKFKHLLRSALCSCHKSRAEKFLLDLDNNEMYGCDFNDILQTIETLVIEANGNVEDVYVVPTVNGKHIISPPFNTLKFNQKYPFGFMDNKTGYDIDKLLKYMEEHMPNFYNECLPRENDVNMVRNYFKNNPFDDKYLLGFIPKIFLGEAKKASAKSYQGWLHKDGVTLLYYSNEK